MGPWLPWDDAGGDRRDRGLGTDRDDERADRRTARDQRPAWVVRIWGTERGRYEVFWVAAQNKPMDPEALVRTKQYRDYSVWKDILSDRVLVRVQTAFTPVINSTPLPQAAFPLDWSRAQRLPDDWGFEVWQLTFSVNQIPYAVVAHVGPDASPYDRAAVRAAIVSIRP